jgi:23S rRNA (uridine2552-2'-O)-methyltransferase
LSKGKQKQWYSQHARDPYVKRAQAQGLRSRAAFKLQQLLEDRRLIQSGMTVIDLGAAPGSWCQTVRKLLGQTGRVIAIDLLPMTAISDVQFIQGDFLDPEVVAGLEAELHGELVDLLLSDMAPNLSGQSLVDQARSLRLWQAVITFAQSVLKPTGALIIKIFQGEEGSNFQHAISGHFKHVSIIKPPASRAHSREVYLVCQGFKG